MNTIEGVRKSVTNFEKYDIPHALLHTANLYPKPHHLVRLGAMTQLGLDFPRAVIGLSNHTIDNYACIGGVAVGVLILERHITDTLDRKGPDITNSMEPAQCRELIKAGRIVFMEIGGEKGLLAEEQVTIDFAFATVVTINPIKSGTRLTERNIWVKRPGTEEILAEKYREIADEEVTRDLEVDSHLTNNDIEWWRFAYRCQWSYWFNW